MSEEQKAADAKAAEEKKAIDTKAADDKKAIDAKAAHEKKQPEALAAQQKTAAEEQNKEPVVIVGVPNGPFTIYGAGFGPSQGTLTVGGLAVMITRWNDNSIKGTLPVGAKGDVVLTTSSGVRKGKYPTPPPAPVTTTTTTTTTK